MSEEKSLLRVALYARVSSDQQAEAGTIASQVAELRERIERDGSRLEEECCFLDEGCSGGTLVRPALERLRDQAAHGAFDRLYVHNPDRLARSYAYQFLLVEELTRAGVAVVFLNRALGRSPEDDLLLQVQGVIAEYERAKIAERSRRGKLHAARRGSVSVLAQAPYGYRYVSVAEGGGQARYEIVWEEARVVQHIFTWVGQERMSVGEVCRRLEQRGLHTRSGRRHWQRGVVAALLKNPAYKGQAGFGKSRNGPLRPRLRPRRGHPEQPRRPYSVYRDASQAVVIAVPALVSEELFAAVAEQLAENRRRHRQARAGPRHLLQGLLVCGVCGYALCGWSRYGLARQGPRGKSAYYRCTGRLLRSSEGERLCRTRTVRCAVLEAAVWSDVCQWLEDPRKIEEEYQRRLRGQGAAESSASSRSLEGRIRHVQRTMARLIDAYGEGLVDKAEFEPRIRQAKERLAQLQAEAKRWQSEEACRAELRLVIGNFQEFAARVKEGLADADWASRREIIRALVKRIEIDDHEVRVVYRVSAVPFAEGPKGGVWQDCRRHQSFALDRAGITVLRDSTFLAAGPASERSR